MVEKSITIYVSAHQAATHVSSSRVVGVGNPNAFRRAVAPIPEAKIHATACPGQYTQGLWFEFF